MGVLPLRDREGVDVLLGEDRARDGCQREEQQQDEGRAHRGELAPRPARELARCHRGGQSRRLPVLAAGHTATSNSLTIWTWIHCTMTSHQPVSRSRPTATSIRPPARITHFWWRRMTAKAESARR